MILGVFIQASDWASVLSKSSELFVLFPFLSAQLRVVLKNKTFHNYSKN